MNISYLLAVAAVPLALSSCGKKDAQQQQGPPPAVPVVAYQVQARSVTGTDTYPASVVPLQEVELRPQVAGYIASIGFPFPLLFAWLAAFFEVALVLAFLTGAFFSEAALLAAIYVVFLAFAFHGPSLWAANQSEFGFFINHFTFLAGLLYAAVHGPGEKLALRQGFIWR